MGTDYGEYRNPEPLLVSQGGIPYNKVHLDAKDAEIDRLRAEINSKSEQIGKLYRVCNERDVLRAALKPFADIGLVISHAGPVQLEMIDGPDLAITPADVHRARAALGDG